MLTAYLDAFSGLSGDMLVGAMLDCGVELAELETALSALPLSGWRISAGHKTLAGIVAVKFNVEVPEAQPERDLGEIRAIIEAARLTDPVKRRAIAVFEALARAEAKVHRTSPERVHFHEVGAVDSIIDVVAAAWGFERLGVGRVLVSGLPMGAGFARSRHGAIPVPAPATAELLAGFAVRLGDGAGEMVTPTGAAVLKALAHPAPLPLEFGIERIGYGAGSREFEDRPNVLRMLLGEERAGFESDEMVELAANIDDLNPQIYDHLMDQLFVAGARDVTLTPTIMKKGRPAVTLGVICEAARREEIARVLFAETSTIGLRFHLVSRLKLRREMREVATRFGPIHVKVSHAGPGVATVAPEYEDCRRAALEHRVALKTVMEEARAAALEHPHQQ
jgi:pyridinium-3,5-bisthiocarboxylic acid mononucleotide nickel chelatase